LGPSPLGPWATVGLNLETCQFLYQSLSVVLFISSGLSLPLGNLVLPCTDPGKFPFARGNPIHNINHSPRCPFKLWYNGTGCPLVFTFNILL